MEDKLKEQEQSLSKHYAGGYRKEQQDRVDISSPNLSPQLIFTDSSFLQFHCIKNRKEEELGSFKRLSICTISLKTKAKTDKAVAISQKSLYFISQGRWRAMKRFGQEKY